VCTALGELEDAPARYVALMQAFDRFVLAGAARRSGGSNGPEGNRPPG